jgi:hypothetical protein
MCYQIPGSITKDGKPIIGGLDIDDQDYAFAAKIYPKPDKRATFVAAPKGKAKAKSKAKRKAAVKGKAETKAKRKAAIKGKPETKAKRKAAIKGKAETKAKGKR